MNKIVLLPAFSRSETLLKNLAKVEQYQLKAIVVFDAAYNPKSYRQVESAKKRVRAFCADLKNVEIIELNVNFEGKRAIPYLLDLASLQHKVGKVIEDDIEVADVVWQSFAKDEITQLCRRDPNTFAICLSSFLRTDNNEDACRFFKSPVFSSWGWIVNLSLYRERVRWWQVDQTKMRNLLNDRLTYGPLCKLFKYLLSEAQEGKKRHWDLNLYLDIIINEFDVLMPDVQLAHCIDPTEGIAQSNGSIRDVNTIMISERKLFLDSYRIMPKEYEKYIFYKNYFSVGLVFRFIVHKVWKH